MDKRYLSLPLWTKEGKLAVFTVVKKSKAGDRVKRPDGRQIILPPGYVDKSFARITFPS